MIKRIVRLSFDIEKLGIFQELFEESKTKIRSFPGCHHLELLKEVNKENVFFTYSIWDSLESLESYRNSELFKKTWKRTKVLFNDKPQAWSLEFQDEVDYEK
jgi:heme-degrading monooxygenase HmoA